MGAIVQNGLLTLGELRRATGGFEAVLLSVLRVNTVDFTGFFRLSRLG